MIGVLARAALMALAVAVATMGAAAQQASDVLAPEGASGVAAKAPVHAKRHMVVAANPIAAEAGLDVLRAGGTAADALVAIQAMLGLVEPQSSGLGGGAFLVWFDAATGTLTTFDGRETAPAAATGTLFLDASGKPLDFFDAVIGGRSVGVPGVPRLLETVHARFGKRPWAELLEPAAQLAETGFAVSERMSAMIADDAGRLDREPSARAYFFDAAGAPLPAGTTLHNPAYAASLRLMASGGADAFYKGPLADAIVAAVQGHPTNPGLLSREDMAAHTVKERAAVCAPYRGFEVCGMGPPSSGAIAIGQILGMVEPFPLRGLGPDDPVAWRVIGDATRLAFADRERYVADGDFVRMPAGLLDPGYLAARSALIRRPTALPPEAATAGEPPWDKAELRIDGVPAEMPSTSHVTIVDDQGNVAAMTTSVENAFGSRLMVAGFLLNNQLTDFSFAPTEEGTAVANRVEAGKRPRSSMSPTVVLKDGRPAYALGSPGGSRIIPFVAKTLIALIDWDLDMQAAVSMPHLANRFGTYELEEGTAAVSLAADLEALGYKTAVRELNSGLHGIAIGLEGLTGGADPRREGVALGD
ncbi:MAG: gamma-glutamyltransferase [Rhizobiaceae bacterium]|nr:MAG: gamma-glutamyltransferase [Rhizobiaceae bacterium]CAG1010587.1 gamma-glutamyltranspeptidase / glutathione hydrolase [Rhizobiaceae bacterium]